jgi:para-aminobenzoate synthetase/4-amino-4-deoxychorismate lyase
MIVDLERNDLSRLCVPGSIEADRLFDVVRYPTVFQMTSRVRGRLRPGTSVTDILKAIFPCGSVTGAPKIRAMEIIRELETEPRGVYTGAIGRIAPDGDMHLSVPIRTLALDAQGRARFGLGSGIVADSRAGAEYAECLLKQQFLDAPQPRPALIETMLWDRAAGFALLDLHMARLTDSARYFEIPLDRAAVEADLADAAEAFGPGSDRRVRLLVSPTGAVSVTAQPLDIRAARAALAADPPRIAFARDPVDETDPFLFHKTTRRARYNDALARARKAGFWDLVFRNSRGEVTEGARSTIFVRRGDVLLTPPVESGLLPGIYRSHLLSQNTPPVKEQILRTEDLTSVEPVLVANAIYGLFEARIVPDEI